MNEEALLAGKQITSKAAATGAIGHNGQHRIGQVLCQMATLKQEQLAEGLERQQALAGKHRYYLLGRILISLGYVTGEQVKRALTRQQRAARGVDGEMPEGNGHRDFGQAAENSQEWQVVTETGPVRPISTSKALANIHEKVTAGELETMMPAALGFDPLDEALAGGVRPGELLLIGGGQGVGKTTFAFQMARNIAASEEANCLYICYEHDEENLTQRLIAMESIDPQSEILRPGVTVRELGHQIKAAHNRGIAGLYELLQRDPRTNAALQRIRRYGDRLYTLKGSGQRTTLSAIGKLVEAYRVRSDERLVVFVDYLQKVPLLNGPADEHERVTAVAEGLKELAMTHQIPVVAITAADREGLKARRMHAQHFAGSASLAYEADAIVVLSEKYDSVARVHIEFNPQKAEAFRDWLVCSIEKNRSGRDVVDMEFEKRFSYCCLNPNGKFVTEKLIDGRLYVE